jgi:TetR/AcrR family transcriptional regulator, cholesterol catabolism regulator
VPRNRSNGARRRRDDEVLAAAVKVFHARSYEAATVQDVADELGILKGSLYHYIDSKEDLLFRVCEAVHRDVEAIFEEVRAAEGLTPIERLRLYVQRQVEYNLDHLAEITVYHHDGDRLEGDRKAKVLAMRRSAMTFVTGLIKQAQAAGEVDAAADPRIEANCLLATIIWTYRWYKPGGRDSRQKIAAACATYAIGGVLGETRKRARPKVRA